MKRVLLVLAVVALVARAFAVGAIRRVVDQAAAVLILQAALDAERAAGRPPGERVGSRRRKARTKDRDG